MYDFVPILVPKYVAFVMYQSGSVLPHRFKFFVVLLLLEKDKAKIYFSSVPDLSP